MASSNLTHPRDRLPQAATTVLDSKPEVIYHCGRFSFTKLSSTLASNRFTSNFGRFKNSVFL